MKKSNFKIIASDFEDKKLFIPFNNLRLSSSRYNPQGNKMGSDIQYISVLNEVLQPLFTNYEHFLNNPIDCFAWGYISSVNEPAATPTDVLKKVLLVSELEQKRIISMEKKFILYSALANDFKIDVINTLDQKEISEYNKNFLRASGMPLNIDMNREEQQIRESLKIQQEKRLTEKLLNEELIKQMFESKDKSCGICLNDFEIDEFTIILANCENQFHQQCLTEYAQHEVNNGNVPIKCPDSKCKDIIADYDLSLLLSLEDQNKYQRFILKKYVDSNSQNASWCPTPNCGYIFYIENENDANFTCPLCSKNYCLKCRVIYHTGQSCKEYQINNNVLAEDLQFEGLARGIKLKQCAKCKFWVEKSEGCNYMKCRCGNEFCYSCGAGRGICHCGGFGGH